MPYWKKGEQEKDGRGVTIRIGDVLKRINVDPGNAPWTYFGCEDGGSTIEVRDFNAHNVCMAKLEELEVIGHWIQCLDILRKEHMSLYDCLEWWPNDFDRIPFLAPFKMVKREYR
jgi:hypothetical protein